jgi:ketosteroid isomerase-like protein
MQQQDLLETTENFYKALNKVLEGDPDPVIALWSHRDDVTYMSPLGELLVGWAPIEKSWRAQAAQIRGGPISSTDVRVIATSEMGIVVGFERGLIQVDGKPLKVDIRATSTYRLENGRWMMIGHHTDKL